MPNHLGKGKTFSIEYFTHSSPLLDSQDCWHRVGVTSCPHCKKDFQDNAYIWEYPPNLIHVIFEPKYFKKGCIVTVSSCPKCNQLTWCHHELDWMIHRMKFDKQFSPEKLLPFDLDKLEEERKRLIQKAKDIWDRSLCKKCAVPKEVTENKYGNYVDCDGHCGSPSMPDEKPPFLCTSFKENKNVKTIK